MIVKNIRYALMFVIHFAVIQSNNSVTIDNTKIPVIFIDNTALQAITNSLDRSGVILQKTTGKIMQSGCISLVGTSLSLASIYAIIHGLKQSTKPGDDTSIQDRLLGLGLSACGIVGLGMGVTLVVSPQSFQISFND